MLDKHNSISEKRAENLTSDKDSIMPPKAPPPKAAVLLQSLKKETMKADACMKQQCKPELDAVNVKNKPVLKKLDDIKKEVKEITNDFKQGKLKMEDAKPKLMKALKTSQTLILKGLKNAESSHACAFKNCSTEILAVMRTFEQILEMMCRIDKRMSNVAGGLCEMKKDVSDIVSGKKKLDSKSYTKIWSSMVRILASTMQKHTSR